MDTTSDFPKLPDQDDYLLNLQNNNYSEQTIYNYARDLCIFSLFVFNQDVEFHAIDKKLITLYKGYLRNGDHLKDLDRYREEMAQKVAAEGLSEGEALRGSLSDENSEGAMIGTPENQKISKTADSYLSNVYKKVYGNLGFYENRNLPSNGDDGLSPASINRMLSAIRSYLKYRIDFDLDIPLAPDSLRLIKTSRKKPQLADFDEIVKLIEFPIHYEKDKKAAVRNRTMLEMLFSTGMRISELIGLDLDQINAEGKLFILGKGKKQRYVYLTKRAKFWLDQYLAIRLKYVGMKPDKESQDILYNELETSNEIIIDETYGEDSLDDSDASEDADTKVSQSVSRGVEENDRESEDLMKSSHNVKNLKEFNSYKELEEFPYIDLAEKYRASGYLDKFYSPALFIPFSGGRNGKRGKRLSKNFFQEKIAEYRRRLGIQVPTSAHSLRHGFATYLAENGAPAAAIQILLGHESLSTTTRYVHASDRFAEEQHSQKHPLG